jgi:glucans biosynthesis protein
MGTAAWGVIAALAEHGLALTDALADGTAAEVTEPFAEDTVKRLAEQFAGRDFAKPRFELPEPFNALTVEQFRDIRYRPEATIWRADRIDYEVQLLPLGWLYEAPVDVWIVEGGTARKLRADSSTFSIGPSIEKAPDAAPFGLSGFRINGTINRADVYDEFIAFQGASYFKAIGRNQSYGLSARGLAVNTARASGEEFPVFRTFWIERPVAGADAIVVHALLDSESLAGAYRFVIRPGHATTIDVEASLYPRRELQHVGLAPLTSMYFHGTAQNRFEHDYRPAVHNSEGLAVLNGHGERLWRPITNPKMLQTSAFVDKDLRGFGLAQRNRAFSTYEDLEARYDRRPTAWVEPIGSWGDGYVELIEIPIPEEIHDNIVAYWKPATALVPGTVYTYRYRLFWSDEIPAAWAGAWVAKTHVGAAKAADTALFVVDFAGPAARDLRELPAADLVASAGATANLVVQRHPEIQGVRVMFELNTAGTDLIELRLSLKQAGQLISENWLYRWTRA